MKKLLKTNKNWEEFEDALLEWRNTPRADGLSPSEWVFGRRQRTSIVAHPSTYQRLSSEAFSKAEDSREMGIEKKIAKAKDTREHKKFEVGQRVVAQDPKSKKWNKRFKVIGIRHKGRSYLIEEEESNWRCYRNRTKLRPARDNKEN